MRLGRWTAGRVPFGAGLAHSSPPTETSVPASPALLGSWSATRWQYSSNLRADRAVDLVCDLRGSVTLSLGPEGFVLTWVLEGGERQAIGGGYAVQGGEIEFSARGAPERAEYHLGSVELSLSSDASAWDFDGDGEEEPARFVAVFVRL